MIDNRIDELFQAINESSEYQEYLKITNIIKKDPKLINLIEEIKRLNKEATILEYNKDPKYIEIDQIIKDKLSLLNNNPLYLEYKNKMDTFNDILSESSNILKKYIDDIV